MLNRLLQAVLSDLQVFYFVTRIRALGIIDGVGGKPKVGYTIIDTETEPLCPQ